jgi:hypothetical protein
MKFDSDNSVFVAGSKFSNSDYTTTIGAFMETPPGGNDTDVYIAHLSADFSSLIAATFIGTGDDETPYQLLLTDDDQIIVSVDAPASFPVTIDAFDDSPLQSGSSVIFKMDKSLTTLNASTFIDLAGGARMYLESDNNLLLMGITSTNDFPGGNNPSAGGLHGGNDFGIARLNSNLSMVSHSACLGGTSQEVFAKKIVKDSTGNVIFAGTNRSSDIETTENAYDRSYNGSTDIIIIKIPSNLNPSPILINVFCDSFESPNANGTCE